MPQKLTWFFSVPEANLEATFPIEFKALLRKCKIKLSFTQLLMDIIRLPTRGPVTEGDRRTHGPPLHLRLSGRLDGDTTMCQPDSVTYNQPGLSVNYVS